MALIYAQELRSGAAAAEVLAVRGFGWSWERAVCIFVQKASSAAFEGLAASNLGSVLETWEAASDRSVTSAYQNSQTPNSNSPIFNFVLQIRSGASLTPAHQNRSAVSSTDQKEFY